MNLLHALNLVAYLNTFVYATHLDPRDPTASLYECYDYIIVGGGISGLVVANRLTEDPNVTVLVLEAGKLDHYEDFIQLPFEDGDGLGSIYDWNLWTVNQTYLDGKPRPYDMGKGVGGGSLINGMCWTRGGSADFDAWEMLGNAGWNWDSLLHYFKKVENYTDDVNADFSQELYIDPDHATHGTDGYVHVSYPKYFYNQSQNFLDGLHELGIPILTDPNNGTAAGGMLIPNSINPENQTRSDARTSYYDVFIDTRSNLHVLSGQFVTQVLVESPTNIAKRDYPAGLFAYGVEFANSTAVKSRITCSREIILAAGAVHTPQILELSGIGQAEHIGKFDIPVLIDLPGVGNNLQDHPYVGVYYYYMNSSYSSISTILNSTALLNKTVQEYFKNKTGPYTAGAINTVAFPSLPSVSNNWTAMMADASSQDPSAHLLSGLDPTVLAGYAAQKSLLISLLSNETVGAYEILTNSIGLLAVAAMHPLSRGSIHISSSNPFSQPLIDPRYCSNPLDCQVLVEALLFNNRLINTTAMRLLDPAAYSPFLQEASPESLLPAILSGLRTEFHGTGTTAMMPRDLGGVVDTHLRVWGTKNLRIVDAGIFPLIPAAHLQASVYAVAEKAADLIKLDNYALTPGGCGVRSSFAQEGPVLSHTSYNPNQESATSSTTSTTPNSDSTQGSEEDVNVISTTPNSDSQQGSEEDTLQSIEEELSSNPIYDALQDSNYPYSPLPCSVESVASESSPSIQSTTTFDADPFETSNPKTAIPTVGTSTASRITSPSNVIMAETTTVSQFRASSAYTSSATKAAESELNSTSAMVEVLSSSSITLFTTLFSPTTSPISSGESRETILSLSDFTTSDELTTTIISTILLTKTTTIPSPVLGSSISPIVTATWAIGESIRTTVPLVTSSILLSSISQPSSLASSAFTLSSAPVETTIDSSTTSNNSVEPTTTLISTILLTKTTTLIPQQSTSLNLVPVITWALGMPLRYTDPATQGTLTSVSASLTSPIFFTLNTMATTVDPTLTIMTNPSVTSSTLDDLTTTLISHITLTETTTIPRYLSTVSSSSSVQPTVVMTWNNTLPAQVTSFITLPRVSAASTQNPLSLAASWFDRTNGTWKYSSLPGSTLSSISTQVSAVEVSQSTQSSANVEYLGYLDFSTPGSALSVSSVGMRDASSTTAISQDDPTCTSRHPTPPVNPGYYGYYGFSRERIPGPTDSAVTSNRAVGATATETVSCSGSAGTHSH